ncbi:MAG: peptide chain release factor N(5)-glutamine methyltransferase [Gammaproteobacteria bacterium]|nr:peptide chain release factor N(5)-glutamine methyltransferase [Gammaproteobacteria bacterium]
MSNTLQDVITQAAGLLADCSENPRLDAELLLAHVMGKDRGYFYTWPDQELDPRLQRAFDELLKQRLNGTPIAYLIGTREFWSMDLSVTPDVLIPRADTEILVEQALEKIPSDTTVRILDLGTGSGAIALAIAYERPLADIYAIDQSQAALDVAKRNAEKHGLDNVHFACSNWYEALPEEASFDLIVSNPPYIRDDDPHLVQGDLPHEPRSALASGKEGLDDIQKILSGIRQYLKTGGWLMVEHGYDQGAAVQQLFTESGLEQICCHQDLQGLDRICIGRLPV